MRAVLAMGMTFACSLFGQTTLGAGALAGIVSDSSDARIADASIVLTNLSKGSERKTSSGSDGSFLFPVLLAGTYSLHVEKAGFDIGRVENLKIDVGQRSFIEVTLTVGEVQTSVTVVAPSETVMNSESNFIGSLVGHEQVRELPLNGRNLLQLALLTGGTREVTAANDVFSANVGLPNRIVILPGAFPYSGGYSLNGINVRGSRDGELSLSPSPVAIQEFKVQTNFLMPDQGVGSSLVNIVTKSGTNQLHGEAYWFFRNKNLDARSFFAPSREDVKRNQFGLAVDAPLIKDRLWISGFYEGLRDLTAFSTTGFSPTAEMFNGDFATTGRPIYDPNSYNPNSATRQPFSNFTIPLDRINPVARNLLKYYQPGSSLVSRPNNIYGNPRKTIDDDQGGIRLDAQLSSRSQLFGQFFQQNTPSDQPGLFPLSGLLYQNQAALAMLQHSWMFSPTVANTFRLGFLRAVAVGGNEGANKGPLLTEIGVTNTFDANGVSAVNLQGYSPFGRSNGQIGNRDNTWQLDDEISLTKSSHSLAFGAGMRFRRGWHLNGNAIALGSLSFQPAFTAQLGMNAQGQRVPLANTGDAFADFLLGAPVSGLLGGLPEVQFRSTQAYPFFQDTWRLGRGLTLNYGLSWFFETPPGAQGSIQPMVHSFDFASGLLKYAGLGEINSQPVLPDKNNFAPRLGMAWQPSFVTNTVFRAGFGTYYSEFPWLLAAYPLISGSPIASGQSFTNVLTNPTPTFSLGMNVFPPFTSGGLTPSYSQNLPRGTQITAINPQFRTNYASQWNASIQHNLSRNDLIEISYIGSSAHRLPNIVDLNQCRSTANLFCDPATKPWPQYGLFIYADSSGNSSYNALITRYERRTSLGLNLRVEYTFGKALSDAWQAALSSSNQITDCRKCSKSPTTFDVRHRAVTTALWDLPWGKGKPLGVSMPKWANSFVGDWTVSVIATFSTGQPVNLKAPNQTGSQFINPLPNRVCDGRNSQLADNIRSNGFLWFDPSCFQVPAVGYFGNSSPIVLYGPGLNNWDLGITKTLPIRESLKIQFRAEMFNAWNHTQFLQPNGDVGAGVNFGRISSTRPPRLIQLAVKLLW